MKLSRVAAGLIVLVGLASLTYVTLSDSGSGDSADPTGEDSSARTPGRDLGEPELLGKATPLVGLDGWLQSDIGSLDDLAGRVYVLQFWTFGCVNCKNTIPHLQDLHDDYGDAGLEIVGVHSPEFDYERDPEAIAEAAVDHGVTWPIALDTERDSFHAWQERPRFWPRTYVVDRDGNIRYDHIGEGSYDELRATVEYLLG